MCAIAKPGSRQQLKLWIKLGGMAPKLSVMSLLVYSTAKRVASFLQKPRKYQDTKRRSSMSIVCSSRTKSLRCPTDTSTGRPSPQRSRVRFQTGLPVIKYTWHIDQSLGTAKIYVYISCSRQLLPTLDTRAQLLETAHHTCTLGLQRFGLRTFG
jgi:hypothetical protein